MKTERYHCPFAVDVMYDGETVSSGAVPCIIGRDIKFNTEHLQAYVPGGWDPIIYDVMLLAAAVEACDHSRPRATMDWSRDLTVSVPVHDPERWSAEPVSQSLHRALKLLTGDEWNIRFRKTAEPQQGPAQSNFGFAAEADMIIPFSDGLDSRAVAGLIEHERKNRSIRVRVGAKRIGKAKPGEAAKPFANLPFSVSSLRNGNGESSGRSRGFKFALMSGLAAFLVGAHSIIVPESGQGALGPVLVNTGQTYFDRRTHPQFTHRMSIFLEALFGQRILFEHPRIWHTKGETLAAFKKVHPDVNIWKDTRSCWVSAQHASIPGEHRQCGVCAACMLRRSSLHAAGYLEDGAKYIWENLNASEFWEGAHPQYKSKDEVRRTYAIAGVLHMDHLAALCSDPYLETIVQRQALQLAPAFDLSFDEITSRIMRLLEAHAEEWRAFRANLSKDSFVQQWVEAA